MCQTKLFTEKGKNDGHGGKKKSLLALIVYIAAFVGRDAPVIALAGNELLAVLGACSGKLGALRDHASACSPAALVDAASSLGLVGVEIMLRLTADLLQLGLIRSLFRHGARLFPDVWVRVSAGKYYANIPFGETRLETAVMIRSRYELRELR